MSAASERRALRLIARAALAGGLAAAVVLARAADPELEALRQRVDELARSVDELRDEVRSLKTGAASLAPAAAVAAPAAAAADGAQPASPSPREAAPAAAPAAAVAAASSSAGLSDLAKLKKAWKQVQPGTASDRIHDLLGVPTNEMTINGKLVWYYVYPGIGSGSVFFGDTRRVSSAQSPFPW